MRARLLGLFLLCASAGCDPATIYGGGIRSDLSGRVFIDGQPAAGVTVVANFGTSQYKVQTGPGGGYAFGSIPFGDAILYPVFPSVTFDPSSKAVTIGGGEVQADFYGYAPATVSGTVVWEYSGSSGYVGIAGVSAHVDRPAFPVTDAVTGADGSFQLAPVPAAKTYDVSLGALPSAQLSYRTGDDSWRFLAQGELSYGLTHTAHVVYRPAADLTVLVFVDGQPYNGASIHLNTPMPVTSRSVSFTNLPVQALDVSISGFPPSIVFDVTVVPVQLQASRTTFVTFNGYTVGANRPPTATILAPANGATFTSGTPITFRGTGYDPEDGYLTGNSLEWVSLGQGTLGRGGVLVVDTLSVGQHRIAFRVTDSNGINVQEFLDLTIVPATGGRVAGTVTVDGGASYGTSVELSTNPVRSVLTDANGAYAFEDVPAGAYMVSVASIQCVAFPTPSQAVSVAIGVRSTVNFAGTRASRCGDGSGITPGGRSIRPPSGRGN